MFSIYIDVPSTYLALFMCADLKTQYGAARRCTLALAHCGWVTFCTSLRPRISGPFVA